MQEKKFAFPTVLLILLLSIMVASISAQPANDSTKNKMEQQKEQKKVEKDAASPVYVMMKTSLGDIVLELNREKAPITVENFLKYVDDGFYDGTIFHRIIGNFMIQGGGFVSGMGKKETRAPIKNEWQNGLKNTRGTIAMARLGGQANSATSQFFINTVDNNILDTPRDGSGYAVFGEVVKGMDVVDKIKSVKTHVIMGRRDVPVEDVIIEKAMRAEAPAVEEDKE